MDIRSVIRRIAECDNISFEKAEEKFESWWKDIKQHQENGWKFPWDCPKTNNVGKSKPLEIELKNIGVIDGWYSSMCGYSCSPSFYTEHLISIEDVEYWKYKDFK